MTISKKQTFISGAGTKEQDLFAQYAAKGMPLKEAFTKAGFKGVNKDSPKKLAMKIRPVVMFYRAQFATQLDITDKQIMYEQACMAQSNIRDLIDLTTGEILSPEELPDKVTKAIKKFNVTILPNGSKKWFYEFWDKQRALSELSAYKLAVLESQSSGKKLIIRHKGQDNE